MVILCNNMQKRDQGRQFLRKRNYPAHQITKSFLVHQFAKNNTILCQTLQTSFALQTFQTTRI